MGRHRKPTAIKELEGNPGKRRLNPSEPKPERAADGIEPPPHLNEHAKAEWRRRYQPMVHCGLLTVASLPAFEVYCAAYGRWVEAEEHITKLKPVVTRNREMRANPWTRIARQEREVMKAFMTEFGMTPASLARLGSAMPPPLPKDPDGDKAGAHDPGKGTKFEGLIGRRH